MLPPYHRSIGWEGSFRGVSEKKTPPVFFTPELPQFFRLPTRIQENADFFFFETQADRGCEIGQMEQNARGFMEKEKQ